VIEGPPRKNIPEPTGADDPRTFPDKVQDQQGLILEALQELRRGPPPGHQGADPINMALSIVGAFQSVISPMQEALLAKETTQPNFAEMFQIFQQGMELGQSSSQGAAADPMGAVLAQTLPSLLSAINQGNPTRDAATLLPEARPNPPEAEPMHTEGTQHQPGWNVLFRPYLPMLLKWARMDADHELRAAIVVDELPPEAEAIMIAQLRKGPEFMAEFMALNPEARPWEPWLRKFWVAVADQYPWEEGDMGPHPFPNVLDETGEPEPDSGGIELGTHPEA
jgi:hypothetical protein